MFNNWANSPTISEVFMNFIVRLFYFLFGIAALTAFTNVILKDNNLSLGQLQMLWSTVPAAIFCFVAAFYSTSRKELTFALMAIPLSVFYVLLCLGMYHQTVEPFYFVMTHVGAAMFVAAVYLLIHQLFLKKMTCKPLVL